MIVDMDAGWVGSKSENVEKALVFKCFFLTPYIGNESLLDAKSNFRVQVSIKNGPTNYD